MHSAINTIKYIWNHPLSRGNRAAALNRYLRWQIGSRILAAPVQMPFVNDAVLLTSRGMTGATQNLYNGLSDFPDCSLLLHLLREEDLFVDIGSNVGVYTVLASACVGAKSIAIEPIPQTHEFLCANIRVNSIADRAVAHNIGLGRSKGSLRFTKDQDCMNHVITDENWEGATIEVKVDTLDDVLQRQPAVLCKLDVEGWESEVLAGAQDTLANPSLLGLIIETDSSSPELNDNEAAFHSLLNSVGFAPFAYEPFKRTLTPLPSKNLQAPNTIYLRNLPEVEARIHDAPSFSVIGQTI